MFGDIAATKKNTWAPNMDPGLIMSDHSEDYSLCENDLMYGDLHEGSNCNQTRRPRTSQTKRKHTTKSFYGDAISKIVNIYVVILIKLNILVNEPSSMPKSIMFLDSIVDIYNDMNLYLFSIFFLHNDKTRDTFLSMEPKL